jgi:hypothetical protein
MPYTISNLTSRPIIIPLNSGVHVRLSPGEASAEISDVELKDNAKVGKLEQQRAIAVKRQDEGDKPREARGGADEGGDTKKSRSGKGGG